MAMNRCNRCNYRYLYHLPWPPSVNSLYRNAKRTLLSAKGRQWKELAYLDLLGQTRPKQPLPGPLAVDLLLMRPNDRLFDADNHVKVVLDALRDAQVIAEDHWRVVQSLSVTVAAEQDDGAGTVLIDIRPASRLYRRGVGTLFDRVLAGDIPR